MSMPAAAASAAAGLGVLAAGPCVSLTVSDDVSGWVGDKPALPGIAAAMDDVLRDLRGDVRVVVVNAVHRVSAPVASAAGPAEPAASGADSAARGTTADRDRAAWSRVTRRLSGRPDLLSVAVSAGATTGPGLALALACDLRVLTEDASLCFTEAASGLVPGFGVTGTLVDLVGYARALQLCLTGRPVGAREALQLGLAAVVVPRQHLDVEVDRLVRQLLAVPRDVGAETKALLAGARGRSEAHRREAEEEAFARVLATSAGNAG